MDLYGVVLIGYCLMSNHVHLIAIPTKADGFAEALKQIHGRYACCWNIAHQSSGHVWQGRYYSSPLDQTHLWEALRYTEGGHTEGGQTGHTEGGQTKRNPSIRAEKDWRSKSAVFAE